MDGGADCQEHQGDGAERRLKGSGLAPAPLPALRQRLCVFGCSDIGSQANLPGGVGATGASQCGSANVFDGTEL